MKKHTSRLSRGTSIIEVMFAGAILLLGMVGVVQLIVAGKGVTRDPRVAMSAMVTTNGVLAELAGISYYAIDAGTFDAGMVLGPDGRKYPRTVVITQIGDGGVGAFRIVATTEWKDALGRLRTTQAVTIVSEPPDGGI